MVKRFRLSGEEGEDKAEATIDGFDLAKVLMLLSGGHVSTAAGGEVTERKAFECKTCSRKFPSFQALGGHRASHKKPRPGGGGGGGVAAQEKPRVHECSICGLEFSIGQALGGHMRRHRVVAEGSGSGRTAEPGDEKRAVRFDLNRPPLDREDDNEEARRLPKLMGFTLTPAMVDCFQ